MAKQIFYEDIEEGSDIPALIKIPSKRQLVQWGAASRDFNELHYDKDFAVSLGFPSVIVHGRLKAAFLGQLLTDWLGDKGKLKKLACNYRGNDLPGDEITCKGKVTKKYIQDGGPIVECEVWIENTTGAQTTTGTAVVTLPFKE